MTFAGSVASLKTFPMGLDFLLHIARGSSVALILTDVTECQMRSCVDGTQHKHPGATNLGYNACHLWLESSVRPAGLTRSVGLELLEEGT